VGTLRLADDVRTELLMTQRTIKKRWPVSMDVIADYLILEHYQVLDTGAHEAVAWLQDELRLRGNRRSVIISPRATRLLTRLAATTMYNANLADSVGNFILQENLPTLQAAPELFPGLELRVPMAHESARDHPIITWVYDFAHKMYMEELQRICNGRECDANEAIYRALEAMAIVDLSTLVGTPLWKAFEGYCMRLHGYEAPQRKLVQTSADFKVALKRAAAKAGVHPVKLASFILWNEVRGARIRSTVEGQIGIEALLSQAFGVKE